MSRILPKKLPLLHQGGAILLLPLLVVIAGLGCRKTEIPHFLLNGYEQTNLVSDIPGLAEFTDSNLVNAWGIAAAPSGPIWVSSNNAGLSTIYDNDGET